MAEPQDLTLYREMWQRLAARCEDGLAQSALMALGANTLDELHRAKGVREGYALALAAMADIEREAGVRPRGPLNGDDASDATDDEVTTDA